MLDLVDQGTDMGKQFDSKLITSLDKLRIGFLGCTNAGRCAGQNDSTGGQGGALGKEADQLRNFEDQVAIKIVISF